jgi:hypothetical protein
MNEWIDVMSGNPKEDVPIYIRETFKKEGKEILTQRYSFGYFCAESGYLYEHCESFSYPILKIKTEWKYINNPN